MPDFLFLGSRKVVLGAGQGLDPKNFPVTCNPDESIKRKFKIKRF